VPHQGRSAFGVHRRSQSVKTVPNPLFAVSIGVCTHVRQTIPVRLWISLVAILLPDIQFGDDRIKT
jgi:hypothetical protein